MAENMEVDSLTANFTLSFFVVAIFNGLLVMWKETNEGLLNWMKSVPPWHHHWATHGLILIILFLILGYVFELIKLDKTMKMTYPKMGWYLISGVLLCLLIIFGFNYYHGVILH